MIELIYIFFLITSVLMGGLFVHWNIKKESSHKNTSKIFLAFSGGFILSIVFLDLIPHLYKSNSYSIGFFILIGFLIQLFLEFFSGGIEHGHSTIKRKNKFPISLLIALCFHSFLEGIPLGNEMNHFSDGSNAQNLFLGILFHQIPVSIVLMSILLTSSLSKLKAWFYLIIFSITTPLGIGVSYFLSSEIIPINDSIILAIVVGIFLHLSTTIIFETSENHKVNLIKLLSILSGFALAFFSSAMH